MKTKLTVLFFAAQIAVVHAQSIDQVVVKANELLVEQKFEEAYPLIQTAAEQGHPEGQFLLGFCYQRAYGVKRNEELAVEWFTKSANQGWAEAQFKLSYAYQGGKGVEKSPEKAFEYALMCAKQDNVECIYNVINSYMSGFGVENDTVQLVQWAEKLGRMPTTDDERVSGIIASTRLYLAGIYRDGTFVEKDLIKSFGWYIAYNESKKYFSIEAQREQVPNIKAVETQLPVEDKERGRVFAEGIMGKPLAKLNYIYDTGEE